MIKALVFDLDDSLYAEKGYSFSGFDACEAFVAQKYYVDGFSEIAKKAFEEGMRGNIFNIALDELEIDYGIVDIKQLVKHFRSHLPSIYLFEDAKWALDYYQDKFPLGLITDGYSISQHQKIKGLNIADYFDKIVVSDDLGREFWKPSEKPYIEIEISLNVAAEFCCYVGDNVSKDFITAKKRGWKTVQILREEGEYVGADFGSEYQAEYIVNSLFKLENLLKNI